MVPLSWRKPAIQSHLSHEFSQLSECALPKNSFIKDGEDFHVACCVQLWVRQSRPEEVKATENGLYRFLKPTEVSANAICWRRIGTYASEAFLWDGRKGVLSSSAFYFFELIPQIMYGRNQLLPYHGQVNWRRDNIAGAPSISKQELISVLNQFTLAIYKGVSP